TSFKLYTNITRAEAKAAIEAAHARGLKVTGHLCAVTYREAAEIGIDNLEHGFFPSSDFEENKIEDSCNYEAADSGLRSLALNDPRMKNLIEFLISKHVALTSTLSVFEPATGRENIL